MKTYTIPEAITLLQIDQSTLFRWVKAAGIQLQRDPHDKRRSLLTETQLKYIASARHIALQLHGKGRQASAATEMHGIQDETTTQMHGFGEITAHLERLETELDALKRLGDLSMVLSALDRLETRIGQIEAQVQEIAAHLQGISNAPGSTRKPVRGPNPPTIPAEQEARPTAITGATEDALPSDLVGAVAFADLHGIAATTVKKALASGRLPRVPGGPWKVGRAWVKDMLDQEGRRVFVEAYHTNENFHVCDDPQCVCHEYKTGEQEG